MIDFGLSEEQQQFRDLAHEFAEKEIAPNAAHHDVTGEYPREICKKAWELGLMNTHIPEEYGGLGLGVLEGCLISEQVAWGCNGIGTAMEANTLAEAPIIVAGTDEQKKKWLMPLTEEFLLTAYCVTEPDAGSDVQGIKTRAKRHGNDYVLSGSKMWITNGGVAEWYFVVAYTDPEKRHRGMSAFIVPRDSEGVSVGKKENNLGQRASDTRAVNFQDVKVPAANRIGEEGDGWRAAMAAFDHSRPVVASAAVGLAQSAYDHAVAYAKERKTFGVPIYKHQSIGFMIAGGEGGDRRRSSLWRQWVQRGISRRKTLSRREDLPNLRRHEPDPAAHRPEGDLRPLVADEIRAVYAVDVVGEVDAEQGRDRDG